MEGLGRGKRISREGKSGIKNGVELRRTGRVRRDRKVRGGVKGRVGGTKLVDEQRHGSVLGKGERRALSGGDNRGKAGEGLMKDRNRELKLNRTAKSEDRQGEAARSNRIIIRRTNRANLLKVAVVLMDKAGGGRNIRAGEAIAGA
jgi:hypothetical protein